MGAPQHRHKQVLWPGTDNKTFSPFIGAESWLDNPWYPPAVELWQITAEGSGSEHGTSSHLARVPFSTTQNIQLGGFVENTGFIV